MPRQERRVVLDGALGGRLQDGPWDDVGHERHDAEICLQSLEGVYRVLVSHAPELVNRDTVVLVRGHPSWSGGQNAATMFSPRFTRAFNTLSPKAACPIRAMRISSATLLPHCAFSVGPTRSTNSHGRVEYTISLILRQRVERSVELREFCRALC